MDEMIEHIRLGDVIIVWKLDRLGSSLRDLVDLISRFQDFGVGFKSLQDNIDTTTPTGKLTFHLFAALAEFERDIISERTKAGLASARAREDTVDDRKACPKRDRTKRVWQKVFTMRKTIRSKKYVNI